MRIKSIGDLFLFLPLLYFARAQSTVPTFQHVLGQGSYTLVGRDPGQGGTTTIPTVLVPITLSFQGRKTAGKPFIMDAGPDVPRWPAEPDVRPEVRVTAQVCVNYGENANSIQPAP